MSLTILGRSVDSALIGGAYAAACVAVLASAYALEHLGGLWPCTLCLYQRWIWWIALGLGLVVLLLRGRPVVARAAVVLTSLTILVGASIAGFHVGVEQHWWEGIASCGFGGDVAKTVEALKRQIINASVVRCDEVNWSLFRISLSGYNFLISLMLGAGGLYALWCSREISDGP